MMILQFRSSAGYVADIYLNKLVQYRVEGWMRRGGDLKKSKIHYSQMKEHLDAGRLNFCTNFRLILE